MDPCFSPLNYGPCASCLGHKSMGKNLASHLQYGPQTRLARGMYTTFTYPLFFYRWIFEFLQHLQHLVNTDSGIWWMIVNPLEVRICLIFHLFCKWLVHTWPHLRYICCGSWWQQETVNRSSAKYKTSTTKLINRCQWIDSCSQCVSRKYDAHRKLESTKEAEEFLKSQLRANLASCSMIG